MRKVSSPNSTKPHRLFCQAVRLWGLVRSPWAIVVLIAVIVAITADWIAPQDPQQQDLLYRNMMPDSEHILGTDNFGRDVLSRLIIGTRLSIIVGLGSALMALLVGGVLALLALTLGKITEVLFFGLVDFVRTLPDVLLALILIVALGPGINSVMVALGIAFSPYFAQVARAIWGREMAADYVVAAKSFGAGRIRILTRHLLPNMIGGLITLFAIVLPRCIVSESVLSFLGLGMSPETPTWGRMIADGTRLFEQAPHAVVAPVLALSLFTLSLAVTANRIRVWSDPMRRNFSVK